MLPFQVDVASTVIAIVATLYPRVPAIRRTQHICRVVLYFVSGYFFYYTKKNCTLVKYFVFFIYRDILVLTMCLVFLYSSVTKNKLPLRKFRLGQKKYWHIIYYNYTYFEITNFEIIVFCINNKKKMVEYKRMTSSIYIDSNSLYGSFIYFQRFLNVLTFFSLIISNKNTLLEYIIYSHYVI